ncbi:hypothetical protein ABTE52_22845, partial [Acinetobacter baumannii]
MRNLTVFGALIIAVGFLLSFLSANLFLNIISYFIVVVGSIFFILGVAMFAYGIKGKYRTRDLMLS